MSNSILHEILARGHFSPTTADKYRRVIDAWIEYAGVDPIGWTRIRAQQFYDASVKRTTVNTANIYIASLRYVSKWFALQTGAVDFAIVQTRPGTLRSGTRSIRRALTLDEATRLLRACDGDDPIDIRDRTLLIVAFETGMRKKSLGGARIEAMREHERLGFPCINVPIKGTGGMRMFEVPLSDLAVRAIGKWRKHIGVNDPLFPALDRHTQASTCRQLGENGVYQIITRRAECAGVPEMHPHILRHSFITWREQTGLNAAQIASITGHRTLPEEYRNLAVYIDMAALGSAARNHTPPWLTAACEGLL